VALRAQHLVRLAVALHRIRAPGAEEAGHQIRFGIDELGTVVRDLALVEKDLTPDEDIGIGCSSSYAKRQPNGGS
jgi:hypothetical protein